MSNKLSNGDIWRLAGIIDQYVNVFPAFQTVDKTFLERCLRKIERKKLWKLCRDLIDLDYELLPDHRGLGESVWAEKNFRE